jgi:isopenicillin-N epimerase
MTRTGAAIPIDPPPTPPEDVRDRWLLDSDVVFLNHGSFGARLREVLDAQSRWRERFEAQPLKFLDRDLPDLLAEAKQIVGAFIGMQPLNFGFTTNATESINAVLRSLRFEPGDELVTLDHVYNAVRRTMQYVAARAGAVYREIELPLPVASPDDVVTAIEAALNERTRLVVIDHVSSPTAIVFPVKQIVERCAAHGIDVLVDGAHAPGMLELDVESIGAAYYAGNLHKWVGAPPGAAFLWVRPDRQPGIHPTVISHFLDDGFEPEFAWQGTRDVSSWLAVGEAIHAMDQLFGPNSWPRIRAHNHAMATWVQATLCQAWGVQPLSPLDGSMLGSMATVLLPEGARRFDDFKAFQRALYEYSRIEAPVIELGPRWMIRPCCQVYNRPEQYLALAEAVRSLTS